MEIVKTKSFELSVYKKGDENASKLALILPGRLDTKDYVHMRSHVDFLAGREFLALSFDPPGTWESPGGIELYTMTNYLKAINELIEYFGNKPTFIMGHSRGASMALLAGTTNPNVFAFAAVMSSSRVGGYKPNANDELKEIGYLLENRDLPPGGGPKEVEFKLPYNFFEDQLKHDMTEDIKVSNKSKLFIYGKDDKLAKPEIVRAMYDIAAEPKEIRELNSGHDYRHNESLINEVNSLVGNFLDK